MEINPSSSFHNPSSSSSKTTTSSAVNETVRLPPIKVPSEIRLSSLSSSSSANVSSSKGNITGLPTATPSSSFPVSGGGDNSNHHTTTPLHNNTSLSSLSHTHNDHESQFRTNPSNHSSSDSPPAPPLTTTTNSSTTSTTSSSDLGIHCLFYCEFDNTIGPRLLYQAPVNYMSSDEFEKIGDYVITKPEFCNRVIGLEQHPLLHSSGTSILSSSTTTAAASIPSSVISSTSNTIINNKYRNTTILSFPITIQNEKYPRNSLLFSIGCIVDKAQDITPYYSVLTKLATSFQTYEIENEFLFQLTSKNTIENILNQVLYSLQRRGECLIPIDACNTLTLKLFPSLPIPPEPFDYEVPIMLKNLDTLQYGVQIMTEETNHRSIEDNNWDLALRLILPYINGIYYIKQISILADIDKSIVKKVIQNLVYYGTVKLMDIFQYSNIYATTPQLSNLLLNPELRALAVKYISNDDIYLEEMDKYQQEATLNNFYATSKKREQKEEEEKDYEGRNINPPYSPPSQHRRRKDYGNEFTVTDNDDAKVEKVNDIEEDKDDNNNKDNESVTSSATVASSSSFRSDGGTSISHRTGQGTSFPQPFPYPSFDYVFRLFTSFGAGARVCDICVQYNTLHHRIDDRRLIRFGVLYGLLKRIHKYPVKQQQQGETSSSLSSSSRASVTSLASPLQQRSTSQAMPALPLPSTVSLGSSVLSSLEQGSKRFYYDHIISTIRVTCNGTVPMEALCVEFGQSQVVLENIIDKLGDYVYILR